MKDRKPQNTALLIATLGVYLGLVLAGAAPQVLANAALTKQFNVRDEIEFKDDLENKPDDCSLLAQKVLERKAQFEFNEESIIRYIADLESTLRNYSAIKSVPLTVSWVTSDDARYINRASWDGKPVLVSAKLWQSLDDSVLNLSKSLQGVSLEGRPVFQFAINNSISGLSANGTISRASDIEAHKAFIAYDTALDLYRCSTLDKRQKLLLDNSQFSWTGNQVLIVTRLPRGSLDSLLADAK